MELRRQRLKYGNNEPNQVQPAADVPSILKNKGYTHIRNIKQGLFETTYSALDKHGNEWVIVSKRENGKIKIKGKQKATDTDDLDDLITLLVVLDDD